MVQSVNAWASVMRARCTKLLPSRLNRGWGFSPITNARSDGRLLGPSSPSLGNVIVVPDFHPGFTLISKIFSSIRVERPSGFNRFRVTFNRLEQPKYSSSNVHNSCVFTVSPFTGPLLIPAPPLRLLLLRAAERGALEVGPVPRPAGALQVRRSAHRGGA